MAVLWRAWGYCLDSLVWLTGCDNAWVLFYGLLIFGFAVFAVVVALMLAHVPPFMYWFGGDNDPE